MATAQDVMTTSAPEAHTRGRDSWRAIIAQYQGPDVRRSLTQMATTLLPLMAALYLMYLSLALPYAVTLLLAIPTAGLLVRTFIIMHDCAHGSFLPWRAANETIGFLTGVMTFTPFDQWRRDHALHHASSGDLDRRGHGDVPTLTVREYLDRSRWGQLQYRIGRHPVLLLVGGPVYLFLSQRVRPRSTATHDKQISSVLATNLSIILTVTIFSLLIGFGAVLKVYLPVFYIAAMAGVWLFYVQHQFEGAYWEPHDGWDYATAAIVGSSYFKLPGILRWFTGNIGLHHVHHLGPRIPNYRLQRCHDDNALFQRATVVTLKQGVSALRLALWDEEQRRLVRFRDVTVATRAAI